MKIIARLVCSFAVVSTAQVGLGENVQWKAAVDGNWSTTSRWNPAHAPTSADTPTFVAGTYTITNDTGGDLTIAGLGSNVAGLRSLDLKGHTLTITSKSGLGNYAINPQDGMRFVDGTVLCPNGAYPLLGANGSGGNGTWWLTKAKYVGIVKASGSSRVVVDAGGEWQLTGDQAFPNVTFFIYGKPYNEGYIRLTGEGSKLTGKDSAKKLTLQGTLCRFDVLDGATASLSALSVSENSSYFSNTVNAANGEIAVSGNLTLGIDAQLKTNGHRLRIAGAHGYVSVGGTLKINDDAENDLEFELGSEGFVDGDGQARPGLVANALNLAARTASYAHFAPTALRINPGYWMNANPESSMVLMRLTTANKAALQTLCDRVVFSGYTPSHYVGAPVVSVNDAGTEIVLTSPAKSAAQPPVMTASTSAGPETVRNVTATFTSYGNRSAAAALDCVVSRNADYSDATTQHVASVVSAELPATVNFSIAGCPDHALYYCKLLSTNDSCQVVGETPFVFKDGGVFEQYEILSSGSFTWSDASVWRNLSNEVESVYHTGTSPHSEDVITGTFEARNGLVREFRLDGDAGFSVLKGTSTSLNVFDDGSAMIFYLQGHTFTIKNRTGDARWGSLQGSVPKSFSLDPAGSQLILVGPGTFDDSESVGLRLGYNGAGSAGSIIVRDGAVWKGKIGNWNNGNRVLVQNGTWLAAADISMNGGAAKGYAVIAATGTTSRIEANSRIYVNQLNSKLYVGDGAAANIWTVEMPGGCAETNVETVVRDANLTCYGLNMGTKGNANRTMMLTTAGASAVKISVLTYYEGADARFAFEVPEDGWSAAPLTVTTLARKTDRTATKYEDASVRVAMKAWMRKHPYETVELMRVGNSTDNKAALATFTNRVVFTDLSASMAERAAALVSLSDDGCALCVTAPPPNGLSIILR